jgi:hypothetical protein
MKNIAVVVSASSASLGLAAHHHHHHHHHVSARKIVGLGASTGHAVSHSHSHFSHHNLGNHSFFDLPFQLPQMKNIYVRGKQKSVMSEAYHCDNTEVHIPACQPQNWNDAIIATFTQKCTNSTICMLHDETIDGERYLYVVIQGSDSSAATVQIQCTNSIP